MDIGRAASISSADISSFFVVDDKENYGYPSYSISSAFSDNHFSDAAGQKSESLSNFSCSVKSSAARSFAIVNHAWDEDQLQWKTTTSSSDKKQPGRLDSEAEELISDAMEANVNVIDLLRTGPHELAPSEHQRIVGYLIHVLSKTNAALKELHRTTYFHARRLTSATITPISCKKIDEDPKTEMDSKINIENNPVSDQCNIHSLRMKLEQNERNLSVARKRNKNLLNLWRRHMVGNSVGGQGAMRLIALTTVYSQNLQLMTTASKTVRQCQSDGEFEKFRNTISKIISGQGRGSMVPNGKKTTMESIFSNPRDVYQFLHEQLRDCGCDELKLMEYQKNVDMELKLVYEVGEANSVVGWNKHIDAIRELYECHGECLPALEYLCDWAFVQKGGEEDDKQREVKLPNGPNSYWDP